VKLAIISNVSGCRWAGSETVWHRAAMVALSQGHQVTAIIHRDLMASHQIGEFVAAGGGLLIWSALSIARLQSFKERFFPSFSSKMLDQFDSILISLGSLPSLAYVPGLADGLLKSKTPIVLFCQFNSDHLIISPGERQLVRRVMGKSESSVFCSRRNMIEARRQFYIEPNDCHIILNPIRNRGCTAYPWPDDTGTVNFACVARLEVAWKGQDLLLDVLSQEQWKDRNWKLRLYGEGPDREYLKNLAKFYQISDRVSFVGHRENLEEIWNENHLLLLPSHGEGMPLAALEAMTAGRPVVVTDVGGNSEVIKEGASGFIAEAATLQSFSSALERAWHEKNHWMSMGQSARQTILERGDVDSSTALLKVWSLQGKIESGRTP
jgi:glycosyltransferase involved in cell wall biosynthesis